MTDDDFLKHKSWQHAYGEQELTKPSAIVRSFGGGSTQDGSD